MSPVRILDRYFLAEVLRIFFLFVICFFALFVLIDYTSRGNNLHLNLSEMAEYYLYLLIRRVEILFPFALLVATIRTVCQANARSQLAALLAGGIPYRRIFLPLLFLGFTMVLLLYANNEFLLPGSMQIVRQVEESVALKNATFEEHQVVHSLTLNDESRYLYRAYDSIQERFLDGYWIRTLDDIYRIKSLSLHSIPATGYFVEHLERVADGTLLVTETFETLSLKGFIVDKTALNEVLMPPSDRPLLSLWRHLLPQSQMMTVEQAHVHGAFYRKLTMPWLGLLAALGPIPFCARFRRQIPIFYIYCVSLFAIAATYMWISAGTILVQAQVFSAFWVLFVPMALFVLGTILRFFR